MNDAPSSVSGNGDLAQLLIVDDDEDLRDTIADYFDVKGFSVLQASNGEEARKLLSQHHCDIALIDLHMPGENGHSLCKHIHNEHGIPVIILTGDGDPFERVVGLEVGADDYISKPFELREVLARTRSVIRRSTALPKPDGPQNPFQALLAQSANAGNTERLLLTILFCDIAGSTELAEKFGDEAWGQLLQKFEKHINKTIEAAPGLPFKWLGDGVMAIFTTPGRALRAARAMHQDLDSDEIKLRVGVHCGECERNGSDVAGIGVHIAARVMSAANPGETIVTSTVKQVMTGSQTEFTDAGSHTLKGIADPWHLFRVG
ncbi:MAG: response regulator [Pseudomonadota bacterium]